MEVILRIEDGPEKGREIHFQEADNLLIGREDPTSKAHINIGPDDPYISRHHFIIEVRPPNCLVRDNGSTNGVFVRYKGRRKWERIEESLVNEGDRIKIGKTILAVNVTGLESEQVTPLVEDRPVFVEPEKPGPAAEAPIVEEPVIVSELTCIRCGEALTNPPRLTDTTVNDLDFMCSRCRAEVKAEKEREAAQRDRERIHCQLCGADLGDMANADGRSRDLEGYVFYYCSACAKKSVKMRYQEIGEYMLIRELGRGGMGEVYLAWHTVTGRVVALKHLLPMVKVNREQVLRFMREVNIMNEFIHPGLVRLIESGQQGENSFFISEFIPDGNLGQFIAKTGDPLLPPEQAVEIIIKSLEALHVLHQGGYVHRDIKPENILIKRTDGSMQPKLTDFGLARSYERHGGTITKAGECAGTLMYMPPEQVLGFKNSKPPVDIYAMGVTLYYLLTGHYSLRFPSPAERNRGIYISKDPILMILEDEPTPVQQHRPGLPSRLCSVVNKAVSKEASQRYATADEFAAELSRVI